MPYNFNELAQMVADNIRACETGPGGRPLTNQEKNEVHRLVSNIYRYKLEAERKATE